jgi:hypothetical protein
VLRERDDVLVQWTDQLPEGVLGATDGARKVWIARDQLQAERRCTLTHELVHLEWGHLGEQPPAIERAVRIEAARRLIPIEDLVRAAVWARSIDEAAEELWVDEETLQTRLDSLEPAERTALIRALREREDGA